MPKVNIEDFGGPKRPQSAYFLWMNDNRDKIQQELGTKSIGEVGKEAGARWAAIDAATKKKYDDKATKAKADYEKAMAAFEKTDSFDDWKAAQKEAKGAKAEKAGKGKATKREREEGEPKRPQSAYFLWMNTVGREDQKKASPDASVAELGKLCGEAWKKMTDAEKKPWDNKAAKAKAEYQKAMEDFKAGKKARS